MKATISSELLLSIKHQCSTYKKKSVILVHTYLPNIFFTKALLHYQDCTQAVPQFRTQVIWVQS